MSLKIIIVGNYGGVNYGDETILSSLLRCLELLGIKRKDVTVFSWNPLYTTKRHRTNALYYSHPFNRYFYKINFSLLLSALRRCNLIIIGGGGLLEDINPQALIHYLFPLLLGKLFGKRVVLFSVGVGPLKTKIGREIVRRACNIADAIYTRDRKSFLLLRNIGFNSAIATTVDAATAIACTDKIQMYAILRKEGISPKQYNIGVALGEIPWNRALEKNICTSLMHVLTDVIQKINKNIKIFFFCRSRNPRIISRMLPSLKNMGVPYKIIYASLRDPREVACIVSGMSFLIPLPLHFAIAAAMNDVPCVALSYDDKVKTFCEKYRLPYISLDVTDPSELERELFRLLTGIPMHRKRWRFIKDNVDKNRSILMADLHKCLSDDRNSKLTLASLIGVLMLMATYSLVSLVRILRRIQYQRSML